MTPATATHCRHLRRTLIGDGLLSRCVDCRLVATARRVNFDYDANYFRADGTGYDFDSVFARHFDAARFEPELAALEAAGLRGTVLDVGCAIGTFLHHAQRRGWTVSGVELADFARNEASRRLGVSIAPSLDALPAGAQYDVVTLHHVLEHIDDPAMFLERDVVPRVGRRLLVEVPNFGSLAAQAEGAAWKDLRPEQHVHHFEPDTLRRVLESAGLTVLDVRSLVDPLWNPHQVRRLFRSLRALRGSNPTTPQRDAVSEAAGAAALNAWRPPTGAMAFAITVSRIALAPVVHWIERTGRAERLVIEAQPARFGI